MSELSNKERLIKYFKLKDIDYEVSEYVLIYEGFYKWHSFTTEELENMDYHTLLTKVNNDIQHNVFYLLL